MMINKGEIPIRSGILEVVDLVVVQVGKLVQIVNPCFF